MFWLSLFPFVTGWMGETHFTSLPTALYGKLSPVLDAAAIGLSFIQPWLAGSLYVFVALMWLVPDRRIERVIHE